MDNKKTISEYIDLLAENQSSTKNIRDNHIELLKNKEITLDGFLALADKRGNETLNKIKLITLISSIKENMTRKDATLALLDVGLSPELRVQSIKNNELNKLKFSVVIDQILSESRTEVPKIPDGWPWYGNIKNAIKELESVGQNIGEELVYYGYGEFEKDIRTGTIKFKSSLDNLNYYGSNNTEDDDYGIPEEDSLYDESDSLSEILFGDDEEENDDSISSDNDNLSQYFMDDEDNDDDLKNLLG